MGGKASKEEKRSTSTYSKMEVISAVSDDLDASAEPSILPHKTGVAEDEQQQQQHCKPRKLKAKKAKAVLQQVKQKGAALGSWIDRQLFDTTELSYTQTYALGQAYTQGYGLVGLEMGM